MQYIKFDVTIALQNALERPDFAPDKMDTRKTFNLSTRDTSQTFHQLHFEHHYFNFNKVRILL